VIGGALEQHWIGDSSTWRQNSSPDLYWSAVGVIRGIDGLQWLGWVFKCCWSDWGCAGVALGGLQWLLE
jgi:hypothetical protein